MAEIVRITEEIVNHISVLENLKDQSAHANECNNAIILACKLGLAKTDISDEFIDELMASLAVLDEHREYYEPLKWFTLTCLWLVGKLYSGPKYHELTEPQHSVEQVLDTLGNSGYTVFTLS